MLRDTTSTDIPLILAKLVGGVTLGIKCQLATQIDVFERPSERVKADAVANFDIVSGALFRRELREIASWRRRFR